MFSYFISSGELGKVRWMSVDFSFLLEEKDVTFLVLITHIYNYFSKLMGLFAFTPKLFDPKKPMLSFV